MSMTDTDIRGEVRKLLSVSSKKHGKTENKWGNIGLLVGFVGACAAVVAVETYVDLGWFLSVMIFLTSGGAIFACIYGVGERINGRRAEALAQTFYDIFPKGSAEFEKAVALLRNAKTDTGVEKSLLSALKMDVVFDALAKNSDFIDPDDYGLKVGSKMSATDFHSQMDKFFADTMGDGFNTTSSSGPGWSSTSTSQSFSASKVQKMMFDKMLQTGELQPCDTPDEHGGVGVTPSGKYIYYGNIDIMSDLKAGKYAMPQAQPASAPAQNPADQLLGGFDASATKPASAAEKTVDKPAPQAGFIPLDPYREQDQD